MASPRAVSISKQNALSSFKRAIGSVGEIFARSNRFEGKVTSLYQFGRIAKVKLATNEFVSLVIKSCTAIPLLLEPVSPSALLDPY